ncbi:DUF4011 domain-containing anti-phage protein Hhe [Alteromonas sp. S015]|uniref:DUF4011 domain-containing anti-phage protein Hhe n=1 Tax=Alteromonas sp. S015 TaxID=3117401 RepID=UPI002FE14A5B
MSQEVDSLASSIVYELEKSGSLKAKDIAQRLKQDKTTINRYLYNTLADFVEQASDYSWQLKNTKIGQGVENMDHSQESGINENFAFDALQSIRNRLLDLTSRNRLLNFRYGKSGFVRVIDEMPDQLAVNILEGREFTFIPVDEPTRDELIKNGYIQIKEDGQEVRIKQNPSAKEWAKIKGLNTSYELPKSENKKDSKHDDDNIQSLLFPRELEAQLRTIRSKANTAIEETGANILYLAFGFLEWFEDDNSSVARQAPLFLIPVKVDKASLNKELGTYTYTIEHTGEDIISNLSLREKLKHDFHLELPEVEEDVMPEAYLSLVEKQLIKHKSAWSVKRHATLSMFDFGKLLMYLDLDPSRWPQGANNIQNHAILQQFFAKEGKEGESSDFSSFGTEYPIDTLKDVHQLYPLIDDADSSQHSALVDAIKGKNLVIEGPPGSGKSQTITNLIAAAIAQGKKVLFVAEKMAALQVVQSRLARAGLGDFCLELHSNKTQKKQVYEDLKRRIDHQEAYRYPSSIDLDIQMYEEKKEKLSQYAELINTTWKKSGKTIHQIFTAATRYREEFSELKLDDIKPSKFDGSKFNELDGRRTADELRKYADIYTEVRTQVGSNSQLSEHPWFGVYDTSIQIFDCDEICELLEHFDNAIYSAVVSIGKVSEVIDAQLPETRSCLAALASDFESLPALQGCEDFTALKTLSNKKEQRLLAYIELYESGRKLHRDIEQVFEPEACLNNLSVNKLSEALDDVKGNLFSEHLKPTDIYQHLLQVKAYKDLAFAINEDVETVVEQAPKLEGQFNPTIAGFSGFQAFLNHIASLEPSLVNRRDDIFDSDQLDSLLDELDDLLGRMRPLKAEIETSFKINDAPSANELKELQKVLEDKSMFRWFKGEWRAAKSKLVSFSVSLKPKVNELVSILPKLIEYKNYSRSLADNKFSNHLRHEFQRIDTPLHEIKQLRAWYRNVRESYGVGFGKKVAVANSLFNMSDSTFKGVQHLSKTKSLPSLVEFFNLSSQLQRIFNAPVFNDKTYNLTSEGGIEAFSNSLDKSTRVLQSSCKIEMAIGELTEEVNKLRQFIDFDSEIASESLAAELFGEAGTLSPRKDCNQAKQVMEATLTLFCKLVNLQTNSLKNYLMGNLTPQSMTSVREALNQLAETEVALKDSFVAFKERVELDESAWFQVAEDDLSRWRMKNAKALSQPRWLSTWVDFIRIREALIETGLENLLLSTERGKINLESIENIYLYAVFDSLSREIIKEKKELAYFSGAEQNAIRKQFGEYDAKLKKLQQEKIAFQVAQKGINQTLTGVSSGKVSHYTEMGLINNEVNKKTRHVPIRQLIKRAGTSLSALKPCFMMGPHSVAQYLEPGQIEFDLIVMDEASQIKPEDALGTVARGKQLVVVGDPKQLPPTSFFDKAVENDDDDTTAIEQSESILDVSFPMFNARRLRWHYRSRHESLIAFSNQEFYDSNLVVFPSPSNKSNEFGIKFTYVKTGRFVNQHNIEEAKVIAEAVRRHLLKSSHESLGVVAMSSKQREQIERCVEELSKDDIQFRDALAENAGSDEPFFLKNLENVQGDERDVIFISCTYGPQEAGAAQMPQRFGPINSAAGGRRLNVLFTRSKKRMHVFSSMTEGHIVASESSSPGVHALKSFLNFAQTGKLPQMKLTGKEPDSDFEIAVMNALKLEGFECVPQVGVAGYFIDLAVRDPGQPGRYIMGIECDGATYHSAKSARDRDRLRQSVLESLGWNIKRIWSTDWFKNPQAQIKPIVELLHQLKADVSEEIDADDELLQIEQDINREVELLNELDKLSDVDGSLESKLKMFESQIIAKSGIQVPHGSSILRPAMIDALCEFKPVTKSAFLEDIPPYLRKGTAKDHGVFLDKVLALIAESEEESLEDSV